MHRSSDTAQARTITSILDEIGAVRLQPLLTNGDSEQSSVSYGNDYSAPQAPVVTTPHLSESTPLIPESLADTLHGYAPPDDHGSYTAALLHLARVRLEDGLPLPCYEHRLRNGEPSQANDQMPLFSAATRTRCPIILKRTHSLPSTSTAPDAKLSMAIQTSLSQAIYSTCLRLGQCEFLSDASCLEGVEDSICVACPISWQRELCAWLAYMVLVDLTQDELAVLVTGNGAVRSANHPDTAPIPALLGRATAEKQLLAITFEEECNSNSAGMSCQVHLQSQSEAPLAENWRTIDSHERFTTYADAFRAVARSAVAYLQPQQQSEAPVTSGPISTAVPLAHSHTNKGDSSINDCVNDSQVGKQLKEFCADIQYASPVYSVRRPFGMLYAAKVTILPISGDIHGRIEIDTGTETFFSLSEALDSCACRAFTKLMPS